MTGSTDGELIKYECKNLIAVITLDRAEKMNAFTGDMMLQLGDALRRFDTDDDAHVAILRGNGRAFSSGVDVHQRHMRTREEHLKLGGSAEAWNAQATDLFTHSINWKPVIAVPHGYALGMALGLCLNCDLIVAEEGTRFQITETPRGLSAARYWALMHYRGATSLAIDAALTGRFFTAEEAFAAKAVDRLAPAGEGLDVARSLAAEVTKNPPLGARAAVRMRRWAMEKVESEAALYYRTLNLNQTEDFREATRAFVEKRSPGPFKGR